MDDIVRIAKLLKGVVVFIFIIGFMCGAGFLLLLSSFGAQ